MNTKKIALATLFASISFASAYAPAFADTYSKSDAILVNACLKTGGSNLNTCLNKVKPKNVPFTFFKTKGRNSRTNKWKARKSLYIPHNPASKKSKIYLKPHKGGLRIDACVKGDGWNSSDKRRCDTARLNKIANSFCKSHGYKKSKTVVKEVHIGKHAMLSYKKNRPNDAFWKREKGKFAIKKITCE